MELGVDRLTRQAGERGDVGLGELEHDGLAARTMVMSGVGEIGESRRRAAPRRRARATRSRSAGTGRSARARAARTSDSGPGQPRSALRRPPGAGPALAHRCAPRLPPRFSRPRPRYGGERRAPRTRCRATPRRSGRAGPASPSARSPPAPGAPRTAPREGSPAAGSVEPRANQRTVERSRMASCSPSGRPPNQGPSRSRPPYSIRSIAFIGAPAWPDGGRLCARRGRTNGTLVLSRRTWSYRGGWARFSASRRQGASYSTLSTTRKAVRVSFAPGLRS